MRKLIIIIICLTFNQILFAQIKIPHTGYLATYKPKFIDSVFNNFVRPELPEKYYSQEWDEIYMLCEVQVNRDGTVDSIYSYPLNKHHWSFSQEDSIWFNAENAIKNVAKLWLFKSVEWDIESIEPEEAKKLYTKFNNEKISLPFNGVPCYLLLIKFCHECIGSRYTFVNFINLYK